MFILVLFFHVKMQTVKVLRTIYIKRQRERYVFRLLSVTAFRITIILPLCVCVFLFLFLINVNFESECANVLGFFHSFHNEKRKTFRITQNMRMLFYLISKRISKMLYVWMFTILMHPNECIKNIKGCITKTDRKRERDEERKKSREKRTHCMKA